MGYSHYPIMKKVQHNPVRALSVEAAADNPDMKAMPAFWDVVLQEQGQGRVLTEKEVVDYYDKWAADGSYEKSVEIHGYKALDVLERTMEKLFPDSKDTVTILDVGACTGFAGQRLWQMGFRNIDALDPSSESLRVAAEKGVYRNFFNIAVDGHTLDIAEDSYDAVVLLGATGPKHLPLSAFTEIIRLVAPSGYVVNLMRAEYLDQCQEYAGQWEPMVEQHIKKGRWRLVERQRYPNHFNQRDGYMEVFQVC